MWPRLSESSRGPGVWRKATTYLELFGFALLVLAAALVAVPLGVAVAGVLTTLTGYLAGRGS